MRNDKDSQINKTSILSATQSKKLWNVDAKNRCYYFGMYSPTRAMPCHNFFEKSFFHWPYCGLIRMTSIFVLFALLLLGFASISEGLNIFQLNRSVNKVSQLKSDLVALCRKVNRGLSESPDERKKVLEIFESLEKLNPNKNTLKNPDLNAIWSLEYTTSDSILGRGGSPKVGPILQKIDAINLKAQNSEVVRYFGAFDVPRKVTADLTPVSPSKVNVRFRKFSVGPVSFDAPSKFAGSLDVTYLDKDLRLSRGDKGNIFVLTRYADLSTSK
jgi:hypothetical protein